MLLLLFNGVVTLAAAASATTFKLVAPGATTVQVSINGVKTDLHIHPDHPLVPYYTGEAVCSDKCVYKYVVNGSEEPFVRTLEAAMTSTRNDFFGRPVTYAHDLPTLPHPLNSEWTRGGPKGDIWDDHYIPTIFINGNPTEMSDLVHELPKSKKAAKQRFPVTVTVVAPEKVYSFQGAQFGLHGGGKKHNNAKQSWEWSLADGDFLDNRNWFKLRHMEEDPTQIREKLYSDILYALGAPANRANMVRLFINNEGFGTFNMLDDITQYSFIRAVFYNGKPPAQMGPLFDGASGADFQSLGPDHAYAWKPSEGSPEGVEAIQKLAETFASIDVKNAEISLFDKLFSIDTFLKFMVVEYLTGDWDGYWMQQTNDGAYRDPTENNRWYYLGQDFDATFGVNLAEPEGADFIKVSYKKFPARYPAAILINRLLENPKVQSTFEDYLKTTVSVLFNNQTLGPRIMKYHDFIDADLRWDRSIEQQSPGINFGWTYAQTVENLFQAVAAPNANGGGASWGLLEW
ncbi:coth protein-domain-containing protein [Dichotomocladium elegans]|nr:coth protein-domain-containing protein [Dichotomocladium elegans]